MRANIVFKFIKKLPALIGASYIIDAHVPV